MEHPCSAYFEMWSTEVRRSDRASSHVLLGNARGYLTEAAKMVDRSADAVDAGEAAVKASLLLHKTIQADLLMQEKEAVEATRDKALHAIAIARRAFEACPLSSTARILGLA